MRYAIIYGLTIIVLFFSQTYAVTTKYLPLTNIKPKPKDNNNTKMIKIFTKQEPEVKILKADDGYYCVVIKAISIEIEI